MINQPQQSADNRPRQNDYAMLNVKMRPEHRKAFRIKCLEEDLRMGDLVRDFVAWYIRK